MTNHATTEPVTQARIRAAWALAAESATYPVLARRGVVTRSHKRLEKRYGHMTPTERLVLDAVCYATRIPRKRQPGFHRGRRRPAQRFRGLWISSRELAELVGCTDRSIRNAYHSLTERRLLRVVPMYRTEAWVDRTGRPRQRRQIANVLTIGPAIADPLARRRLRNRLAGELRRMGQESSCSARNDFPSNVVHPPGTTGAVPGGTSPTRLCDEWLAQCPGIARAFALGEEESPSGDVQGPPSGGQGAPECGE